MPDHQQATVQAQAVTAYLFSGCSAVPGLLHLPSSLHSSWRVFLHDSTCLCC